MARGRRWSSRGVCRPRSRRLACCSARRAFLHSLHGPLGCMLLPETAKTRPPSLEPPAAAGGSSRFRLPPPLACGLGGRNRPETVGPARCAGQSLCNPATPQPSFVHLAWARLRAPRACGCVLVSWWRNAGRRQERGRRCRSSETWTRAWRAGRLPGSPATRGSSTRCSIWVRTRRSMPVRSRSSAPSCSARSLSWWRPSPSCSSRLSACATPHWRVPCSAAMRRCSWWGRSCRFSPAPSSRRSWRWNACFWACLQAACWRRGAARWGPFPLRMRCRRCS